MDKEKDKNREELIWEAFMASGKPGYYLLYRAMKEDGEED